jgi:hypothetical protein
MNNDIVNKIKSSLENYEAPYDASAWDKMSQQLDAKTTTGGTSSVKNFLSSPKFWIFASITVIGVSIAIYSTRQEATKVVITNSNNTISPSITEENEANFDLKQIKKPTNKKNITLQIKENSNVNSTNIVSPSSSVPTNLSSAESNSLKNNPIVKGNERFMKSFILPKTNKLYCLGDKVEIFNPNTNEIILSNTSGKQIKIDGQESMLISLKQEGQYTWNGEKTAFEVKEKPSVNFNLPSDIIYENGIPTITLTSDLNVKSQKWIFDQKIVSTNESVKLNIFNKEKYSVTLLVVGQNGCENQMTKTFYPDPDFHYNLKAPNGFDPSSNNPKRNTFLPLSLLERDTPFKMLIIDPKDGKVIFETNDKNNPWDGKNQSTDQLVSEGSEYIWKVILMNPEKYEKNEYRGTITRK